MSRLTGEPATEKVLQWGHGSEAVEWSRCRQAGSGTSGFNGATARRPWNAATFGAIICGTARLQWGHGSEAVECDIPHWR